MWTEPDARGQGLAEALIARAVATGHALGHDKIYLCAAPRLHAYYDRLGWRAIEHGVGEFGLTIYVVERADMP